MANLLRNAIRCPDGTVLESHYRHDFRQHTQEDGRHYSVDGGLHYRRVGFSDNEYEDLCVYDTDSHETIRNNATWGSRGPNGDQPLQYKYIKDMSDEHLVDVIDYLVYIDPDGAFIKVFKDEITYRSDNGIVNSEKENKDE